MSHLLPELKLAALRLVQSGGTVTWDVKYTNFRGDFDITYEPITGAFTCISISDEFIVGSTFVTPVVWDSLGNPVVIVNIENPTISAVTFAGVRTSSEAAQEISVLTLEIRVYPV